MAVRIIVRVIIQNQDRILFLRQRNSMGGAYTLPGGKLDNQESPMEAAIRECYEETGLKLSAKSLKLVHALNLKKGNNMDLFMVFRTKKWKGEIAIKEPEKFKQVVWLEKVKIHEMEVVPIANHIVQQYLQKIKYSDLVLVK